MVQVKTKRYPTIPEEYREAVAYACKVYRITGRFAKSVKTSADYYGVDEDRLKAIIQKRQHTAKQARKEARKEAKNAVDRCR